MWLFGSLAKGRRPTVHSDFDFAVEGLPADQFFGSVGHLLQILPRPVDVVEVLPTTFAAADRGTRDSS